MRTLGCKVPRPCSSSNGSCCYSAVSDKNRKEGDVPQLCSLGAVLRCLESFGQTVFVQWFNEPTATVNLMKYRQPCDIPRKSVGTHKGIACNSRLLFS